jgi:glutaminyl-peptide cyclotransferase
LDIGLSLNNLLHSDERKGGNSAMSLQMMFFDGEEAVKEWKDTDNTYGSRNLAKVYETTPAVYDKDRLANNAVSTDTIKTMMDQVEAMVLLDLLGAVKPWPQIPDYFQKTSTLHAFLAKIESKLLDIGLLSDKRKQANAAYFPRDRNSFAHSISDDHLPFMEKDVPILHLIPNPFPYVWHKMADNADAIEKDVLFDYAKILRVFVTEYLDLGFEINTSSGYVSFTRNPWRGLKASSSWDEGFILPSQYNLNF